MSTISSDPIVIVGAARTPMGSFQGDFSALAAHDLGGAAIKAAVQRAGIAPELVTEVLFGNCLMAGQGQAPARQAAFKGGLPISAGAVGRFPAMDVKLNGVTASTKPSSGRWSVRFQTPGADTGCSA